MPDAKILVAMAVLLGAGPAIAVVADGASQELKIEGDLKAMQGEWVSKDGQGMESIWKFKGEHVSLKTPTTGL